MAVKKAVGLEDKNKKLQKIIKKLKKEEHLLKWLVGAAIVIILILLLLLGYATDWARGLKTSTGTTPISTSQDAATTEDKASTSGDGSSGNGGTGTSGSSGASGTNGSNGSNGSSTNSTTKETNTSSTTNNSTTTNNNTTTETESPGVIEQLYNDLAVGETLDQVLASANGLGIPATCNDNVLLKVCVFQADGQTVTVKSLLINNLVTSITRN